MTGYKKVFIDTAPFIYYIEKNEAHPQYFEKVKRFFMECYEKDIFFYTSVITVEEYMVFPYRYDKQRYIDIFEELLYVLSVDVIEINKKIAKLAARIRAEYKNFKSMDALQLAVADAVECDLFLTNDKQLKQYKKLKCITVEDLN